MPAPIYVQPEELIPHSPRMEPFMPGWAGSFSYLNAIPNIIQASLLNALAASRWSASNSITEGEEVGYVEYDPIIPMGQQNPYITYPGVLTPRPHTTGVSVPTVGAPVFEPGSIFGPGGGMGPLPDNAYDPPPPDTGVGEEAIPDPYEEEYIVADFWDVVSGAVDIWQGQIPGGGQQLIPSFAPNVGATANGAAAPPAKVTVDTRTGAVTPCRRRRRRRLLTSTDINDLAALKAIVGGGQAMNLAVAKAVRR